jgi:hypothetical protein
MKSVKDICILTAIVLTLTVCLPKKGSPTATPTNSFPEGTGEYNSEEDSFSPEVNVSGLAEWTLNYSRQRDKSISAIGNYGDQSIDLKDTGK